MLTLARRILVALRLARTQVWQPGHYFSGGDEYQRWLESGTARIRDMVDIEELRLLLAHRNGYLREAALRRVGELRATALWTEVFGLCNDWVAPIRARAKRVSLGWLRDANAATLLPHLPALAELASRRREDHAAFVAQFESRLIEDQNLVSLFETARASDSRKLARYCFALLERSAFPQERLIELGLSSADVALQGRALQLIRCLSAGEQAGYARSLLASRRNYLRWYGLDMLWRADPAGAREVALSYLLSPYAALRDKAFKLSGLTREALLDLAEQRLRSPDASSSDIRVGLLLLASGGKKRLCRVGAFVFSQPPGSDGAGCRLAHAGAPVTRRGGTAVIARRGERILRRGPRRHARGAGLGAEAVTSAMAGTGCKGRLRHGCATPPPLGTVARQRAGTGLAAGERQLASPAQATLPRRRWPVDGRIQ